MTKDETLKEAEQLKQKKDADALLALLQPFYEKAKTIDIACYLIYAHRRNRNFEMCYKICDEMDKYAGNPTRIKAQRKWTLVFEEVIYETDTSKKIQNADVIFNELDQKKPADFLLAKFICFHMADNLQPDLALQWLQKLNAEKLSNKVRYHINEDEGSYEYADRRFHSEKYSYYDYLSRLIYKLNKVDGVLIELMKSYSPFAKRALLEAIKRKISMCDGNLRFWLFRKILMALFEDKSVMQKAVSTEIKELITSDVSSFVYCPVSAAIKKSVFPVADLTSLDYDEEVSFHRKNLNDLYEIHKNKKCSLEELYGDIVFENFIFSNEQKTVLRRIFNATRLGQNVNHGMFLNYYFDNDDISGSPDMYLKDREEFLVEEVYTQTEVSALYSPHENDLIKVVGYLVEMNVKTAYLFYWNTNLETTINIKSKTAKITGLRIFTIVKTQQLASQYLHAKEQTKLLLEARNMKYPASNINYHKCVNCSVISYCIHKRGYLNSIVIPYKENY